MPERKHPDSRRGDLCYHSGLSELLSEDLSAWEFYNSLSADYRRKLRESDVGSFSDMQEAVAHLRSKEDSID